MRPLEGKVALVTGSTSGIGRGVAERLSTEGAEVVLNSRSAPDAPIFLGGSDRPSLHLAGDVSDESAVIDMISAIASRHGSLDIVVNNAGTTKKVPYPDLENISVADWNRILGVNVIGAWNVIKASVPLLRASTIGAVVNVSSIAGARVSGSSIPYSVSKAALNQLTRTLAKALGPEIRVNAVAPGFIDTPWTSEWVERRQAVAESAPLARVGVPEDVADAVMALISSRYVTGQIVTVDGGLSLNG